MMNPFWAKSNPVETIQQHTAILLKELKKFKTLYPKIENVDWELLELACKYHDLGKMNTKFQNKLGATLKDSMGDLKEIPHGYLSPAFIPKGIKEIYDTDELRILYQSVYYHHARDANINVEELKSIILMDLQKQYEDFEFDMIEKVPKLNTSYGRYVSDRINSTEDTSSTVKRYIMVKGLLNKFDYSASAHLPCEVEPGDLRLATLDYLEQFGTNDLQKYMINNSDKNNIIIASTGIGKTEAALLWIGNEKGFFTLPLKVAINAIYDRIVKKIGYDKNKTGILHSDTKSEYIKRYADYDENYIGITKQMSMHLTVCTLDQLIDFIFKYDGYEYRLASLSYSKIVIDEIQMYSPDLTAYLLQGLKYITDMGGKFSILTATLPGIIIDLLKELKIEFNNPRMFLKNVERHKLEVINEDIDINDFMQINNKKVLVIVNTVKKAQEIYSKLIDLDVENVWLFHSRFIRKDRKAKEDKILEFGDKNCKQSGIWITTQVVEASLDIDFDLLFTELSDVSGLFQRMGRVFRHRKLKDNLTNVYVYTGGDKLASGVGKGEYASIDRDIFELSKNEILKYSGNILDEETKMKIVESVYCYEKVKDLDYYIRIKDVLKQLNHIEDYSLKKNEKKLRNIFNESIIPDSVYSQNKDEIDKLVEIIKDKVQTPKERIIARDKLFNFVADIPEYMVRAVTKDYGYVDVLNIDKRTEIKVMKFLYDCDYGIRKPENKAFNEEMQII